MFIQLNRNVPPPVLTENAGQIIRRLNQWAPVGANPVQRHGVAWDHLIYAYMVESTGIVEVMRKVVDRLLRGETFGEPAPATMTWAYTTERVFFSDSPLLPLGAPASFLRTSPDVERRRAYLRLLGLVLPQAVNDPDQERWASGLGAQNTEFLTEFRRLLRLVWEGLENLTNTAGPKATDDAAIQYALETLRQMLQMRRRGGMIAAEEFWWVSMMSWFHLTISYDSPVVVDLRARAPGLRVGSADRLAVMAQAVGERTSSTARAILSLASLSSTFLRLVESGTLGVSTSTASLLYNSNIAGNTLYPAFMRQLINAWDIAMTDSIRATTVAGVIGAARGVQPQLPALPARPALDAGLAPQVGSNGVRNSLATRS